MICFKNNNVPLEKYCYQKVWIVSSFLPHISTIGNGINKLPVRLRGRCKLETDSKEPTFDKINIRK